MPITRCCTRQCETRSPPIFRSRLRLMCCWHVSPKRWRKAPRPGRVQTYPIFPLEGCLLPVWRTSLPFGLAGEVSPTAGTAGSGSAANLLGRGTVRMTTSTRRLSCRPLPVLFAGDRMELRVPCRRQPFGGDAVLFNQDLHQFRRSGGGQLPIRCELRGVDGNRVGVTFDADAIGMFLQNLCHPAEGVLGLRLHGGRAAVEEPSLTQTDDQAIRLQVKSDFVALDLLCQGALQLPLNGGEVLLHRLVAARSAIAGKRNLVR